MSATELERTIRQLREGTLPEVRARGAAQVRALGDGADDKGRFEAVVSVFGNVDSYGDRILKGAFVNSLAERGFPPIVWTHMWNEVPIGVTEEAEERDGIELLDGRKVDGLLLLYRLFVDDNVRAREIDVAQRTMGGDGKPVLDEYSFAFFVKTESNIYDDDDFEPVDATHWRDLIELDIVEAGPTLLGANAETGPVQLLSHLASRRRDSATGKAAAAILDAMPAMAGLKAGAVLSATNRDRIERAVDALQEVLAAATSGDDDGKGHQADPERQREVAGLLAAFPRTGGITR